LAALASGRNKFRSLNVERLRVHWQFEAAGFLAGRDRHGTTAKLGKSADT
jgi:hypothetical protein